MADDAVMDAVVVGAGLSGLAAGIRLAHFGQRVLVLDRHTRAGGLNSWYRRDGRDLSTGLHAVTNASAGFFAGRPDGPLARLLRQLRIPRDAWRLRPHGTSAIRFPTATLRFSHDPDRLADGIAQRFPGAVDGFRRFDDAIRRHPADDETTFTGRGARAWTASFIHDPLLVDLLMAPPLFYGAADASPPGEADMDARLFRLLWKGIFQEGLATPEGGMRPVVEGLVHRLRDAGGELRLGVGVDALRVEDGEVRAARLSDGTDVAARRFFSSAGYAETLALCVNEKTPGRDGPSRTSTGPHRPDATARRDDDPSASPVTVVEALFRVADGRAPAAVGLEDAATFFSFADPLDFGPPATGLWRTDHGVMAVPDNFHADGHPPENDGTFRLATLAHFGRWFNELGGVDARAATSEGRARYAEAKAGAARALLDGAVRLGLSADVSVETLDVFTPLTLTRYAGHARGAIYGGRGPKPVDGRTAWPNLFLIGADQGVHGIVGALLSGVSMANRHALAAPR